MRVTLVHNLDAGYGSYPAARLQEILQEAGYEAHYQLLDEDLEEALDATEELVIVAGGDGTVRKVAGMLTGQDVAVGVLPVGTANNLARSLGWTGTVEQAVAGWRDARRVRLDAGTAEGPWGCVSFLEAAGMGLFAHSMPRISAAKREGPLPFSSPEEELAFDVQHLRNDLDALHALPLCIALDGIEVSGRFILLEAMNIQTVGPRLPLAPQANPSDGLLDVVIVREEERPDLEQALAARKARGPARPALPVKQAKRLDIYWEQGLVHADDVWWPNPLNKQGEDQMESADIHISLKPQAVSFLAR